MLILRCVEDSLAGAPPLPDTCTGTRATPSFSTLFEARRQGWLPLGWTPGGPVEWGKVGRSTCLDLFKVLDPRLQ